MTTFTRLAYKLKMKYPEYYNKIDYSLLTNIIYDAHIELEGVINLQDLHKIIIEKYI